MSDTALPILRTPRLTLRPLELTDADALVDGVGNFDVSKWLSVVPYPYARADADWFIRRVITDNKQVWAIVDDNGLQGVVGVDDGLGYWIARTVWGKGYGYEAAHAALAHWFESPANGDMESSYFDGNDRSSRVLFALGFQHVSREKRYARALSQDVTANNLVLTRPRWTARQDFTLYTPRLTLRPVTPDDAPVFAALAAPNVARNLARIPANMTEDEARADLSRRMWRGTPGFTLVIEHEGNAVGWVGFGGTPLSVGYALHPDHWGRGLMTETLSAFIPELFDRFSVKTIVADHFDDNPASGAVLRKMGFQKTGEEMGTSLARLEPARSITYAVTQDSLKVPV